jgi:hypothetical protein
MGVLMVSCCNVCNLVYERFPHHFEPSARLEAGDAGLIHASTTIVRTEGPLALYKGLFPTLLGIAPYTALNFSLYDLAKNWFYEGGRPQSVLGNLLVGACTGASASTLCYPLDTIRRRMQMKGVTYDGQVHAVQSIWRSVRFWLLEALLLTAVKGANVF